MASAPARQREAVESYYSAKQDVCQNWSRRSPLGPRRGSYVLDIVATDQDQREPSMALLSRRWSWEP